MNLIDNLLVKINKDNSIIIKSLISIITNARINNLDELKLYEEEMFKTNNQYLNEEEKINYCSNIINTFNYDCDGLDFDEIKLYLKYRSIIDNSLNNEEKIIYIIKLFSLTHRELYFVYYAYNFIIDGKL